MPNQILPFNSEYPKVLITTITTRNFDEHNEVLRRGCRGDPKQPHLFPEPCNCCDRNMSNMPEFRSSNFEISNEISDGKFSINDRSIPSVVDGKKKENIKSLRRRPKEIIQSYKVSIMSKSKSDSYCLKLLGRRQGKSRKFQINDTPAATRESEMERTLLPLPVSWQTLRPRKNRVSLTVSTDSKYSGGYPVEKQYHQSPEQNNSVKETKQQQPFKKVAEGNEMTVQQACRRSVRKSLAPMTLFRREFLKIYDRRIFRTYKNMKKLNRSLVVDTWENLQLPKPYKMMLLQTTKKIAKSRKDLLKLGKMLKGKESLHKKNLLQKTGQLHSPLSDHNDKISPRRTSSRNKKSTIF